MSKSIEQLVSDISVLNGLELAQLSKLLEEKFGVSAAMMSAPAASAAAAPVAEAKSDEKTEYKVELIDAGANKLNVIKAVRTVLKNLGLGETKKLVDDAPVVLSEALSAEEAKVLEKALIEAGAKVKLS